MHLPPMVHFMDEHPDIAACGPRLLKADGSVQHCIRGFAGVGTFVLQALNWHKLFPASRVMNRYYKTDFDYSRAQQVQSISTAAYVLRRSTWEQVGMFDERFGQFMVDHAYNFTLERRGYRIFYTPCAEVIHYGSQSIGQDPVRALREETEAFVMFNESYSYFSQTLPVKWLVRAALANSVICPIARALPPHRQESRQRSGRILSSASHGKNGGSVERVVGPRPRSRAVTPSFARSGPSRRSYSPAWIAHRTASIAASASDGERPYRNARGAGRQATRPSPH